MMNLNIPGNGLLLPQLPGVADEDFAKALLRELLYPILGKLFLITALGYKSYVPHYTS